MKMRIVILFLLATSPGVFCRAAESVTKAMENAVEARVQGALDQLAEARAQAVEAAEAARVAGVISAFLIAATLLSAAAASYFAAVMGGDHRDRNITFRSLR